MHQAPAVSYPVRPPRRAWLWPLVLWLGAGLLCLGWALVGAALDQGWPRFLLTLGVWLLTGLFAASRAGAWPHGQLDWDGEAWHWQAAAQQPLRPRWTGRLPNSGPLRGLRVRLDSQHHLLLWGDVAGWQGWFWLGRASQPERWDSLRRAVYSRRQPDSAAPPGSAADVV